MSDKTTKDAVENFGGVWPDNCDFITVYKGNFHKHNYSYEQPIGACVGVHYDKGTEIIDKQQFEDCVRENMEKQKYKYVDAGIKTVGELVDRFKKEKLFNPEGKEILASFQHEGLRLDWIKFENLDCAPSLLTTRQSLPWYEVEGVFPCLVRDGIGVVKLLTKSSDCAHLDYVTPLTPAEAAEYGVECE